MTYISVGLLNWAAVYFTMMRGVNFKQLADKYSRPFLFQSRYGFDTKTKKWVYIETLGPVAASYAIYKTMLPIRLPVIIGITPIIVRLLKRR